MLSNFSHLYTNSHLKFEMGIEVSPSLDGSAPADIEAEPQPASTATSHATAAAGFPEGGFTAWSVVFGAWCSLFVSFGWITCIGLFQTYYQTDQLRTYSPSAIGWIPSVETFLLFVGSPVFGKIFDSYGPRWLLIAGTGFHVVGLMMLSLSREYYQIFLAQSVCSAIGASAVFWASNNAVGTWFARRRGLALGIVSSGSSIGGVVGT
jgi:MFS family permease